MSEAIEIQAASAATGRMGPLARFWDSDIAHSFRHSPVAIVSAIVALVCVMAAVLAPWIAPHNPFDLASLDLMASDQPPAFLAGGTWTYPLGTDNQARDVFSAILYGARISILVGVTAIVFALLVGIVAGLLAGYLGGWVDAGLMRLADVQLTFPAILIALLIDGIIKTALPHSAAESVQIYMLIFAIGIARWPQFARTVRGSTLVERGRDYVLAARVIGLSSPRIMVTHVLPNVLGPVMVLATLNLGLAILDEATLSFLGVGLPPTQPSLGTLIRVGNDYIFAGEWWVVIFPGLALVLMVLSVNLLGDWLRDALNPRLR
jgi:peptide/nickel transport system permease protein